MFFPGVGVMFIGTPKPMLVLYSIESDSFLRHNSLPCGASFVFSFFLVARVNQSYHLLHTHSAAGARVPRSLRVHRIVVRFPAVVL